MSWARPLALAPGSLWLLAGCSLNIFGSGELTYAVGSRAEIPFLYKECRAPSDRPGDPVRFRFVNKEIFEAAAPGKVKLRCKDGTLTIVVRRAARLSVRPAGADEYKLQAPPAGSGALVVDQLIELAVDSQDEQGNKLMVGQESTIDWRFSGALVGAKSPGCVGDYPRYCPPRSHGFARAVRAGQGVVTTRFGGIKGKLAIKVRPGAGPRETFR